MEAGLRVLVSDVKCTLIAQGLEGTLTEERERHNTLLRDFHQYVSRLPEPIGAPDVAQILTQPGRYELRLLRDYLRSLPLPAIYFRSIERTFPFNDNAVQVPDFSDPLIRIIAFIDDDPIASPQLVRPSLLYCLVFRVRGVPWPVDAVRLHLSFLTTCPTSEYSVSDFVIEKPTPNKDREYQAEAVGQIKFTTAQSTVFHDLVFTVRGAFERTDGELNEVQLIGHHELRFHVVSEQSHPFMVGNKHLDHHIHELLAKLKNESPNIKDELPDLLRVLQALAKLHATYAQEAAWKGRCDVSEAEFQKVVLRDLRFQLGQDVQEHPKQAGGFTDVRFRGVVIELKVERENGDRCYLGKRYSEQATQYSGVEARQVSIILVLDLTEKVHPPSDLRNDILVIDVPTHGGEDDAKMYPSKTILFAINGNMRSPSSYS